jgi:hypothetical protein
MRFPADLTFLLGPFRRDIVTDFIGDDLAPKIMRVTKGADRKFTLRRRDESDTPVDWDAEVYISIDIVGGPVRVDATVSGETADFQIESDILDQVKKTTTWQVIMSQSGDPTLETPLMAGTFERQDGKA